MNKISCRYKVSFGVPFNMKRKYFDTEADARAFIREHVFGEPRYCKLEKVEELQADFEYVDHCKIKDRNISRKMFDTGILKRQEVAE